MKNLDCEIGWQTSASAFDHHFEGTLAACENCRRVEKTIRYMMQHLNHSLQASELAAIANISLSHYFALFKRITGCAPIDFFIRLRMKRARQLLETTSLNIKEVAAELGYEDPFYFSRLFKSVNGSAPTEYRNTHQPINALHRPVARPGPLLESGCNATQHNRVADNRVTDRKESIVHPASATF